VRHYTLGKAKAKTAGSFSVMQLLAEVVQKNLLREQETMWVKEPERVRVDGDDQPEGLAAMQSEIRKEEMEKEKEDGKKDDAVPAILEGMVPATSG
jgi:hypothetical protein